HARRAGLRRRVHAGTVNSNGLNGGGPEYNQEWKIGRRAARPLATRTPPTPCPLQSRAWDSSRSDYEVEETAEDPIGEDERRDQEESHAAAAEHHRHDLLDRFPQHVGHDERQHENGETDAEGRLRSIGEV